MMSADMVIEEIGIVLESRLCPRCNSPLVFHAAGADWMAECKQCHGAWGGGSLNNRPIITRKNESGKYFDAWGLQ